MIAQRITAEGAFAFPMFDIVVNPRLTVTDLAKIRVDQLPFAESLAINTVAAGARDFMRGLVPKEFTIAPAREKFITSLIRFPRAQWATKTKLSATMGVHSSDGDVGVGSDKDRGFLLGRHEDGGTRTRTDPLRPFFIPTDELRGGDYDVPPRSMYPTALRIMEGRGIVSYTSTVDKKTGKTKRKGVVGTLLIQSRTTSRGKVMIQGKQRTFLIGPMNDANPKDWGIYQRTGPGRRDVRLIWAFRTRINLPPRLHFYEQVAHYIDSHLAEEFTKAIDRAMATAR